GTPNELNSFDLYVRGEELKKFSLNKFAHRMVHEFVDFGEIFECGDYSAVERGLKISLDVMKVVDSCRKNMMTLPQHEKTAEKFPTVRS
ncbi:MAG: hypothetical protein J5497_05645, partial [Selenomonadaceae bacterium]|nr:hypothetical protein [Selenomonadaceae bacterium]